MTDDELRNRLIGRLTDRSMVDPDTGCWLWTGAHQPTGYGQLWNGTRPEQAHRISYRIYVGEIPAGYDIDHVCNTRSCVNPDHLRAVTHKQNMLRSNTEMGRNSRKTSCKRGHPLSGSNLFINAVGSRQCRECMRFRARQARARRRT